MLIRRERPSDADQIDAVHREAFAAFAAEGAEPVEVGLVRALRASDAWLPETALVAESPTGEVVGHVCVTRAHIDERPALALGPIGVAAQRQRDGVGGALMHAVLGAADALGESVAVLLGHTDYYPRFGFVPAADLGIVPDNAEWAGPYFQARPLTAHTAADQGTFRYAAPFYDL